MKLMEKKKIFIGLDVGGTNTAIGFVTKTGDIIADRIIETRAKESVDRFIQRVYETINSIYLNLSNGFVIGGIGAAVPCANHFTGMIENPSNFVWGNVNFVKLLEEKFNVPAVITNDANAAALGEHSFGNAKGMKNFVMLTLGTGLGSGIFVEDKLLYGANGLAGELGHLTVDSGIRECSCGRKGCLETYISANGLKRTVAYLLSYSNKPSELRNYPFNEINGEMISDLARKEDLIALETFEYTSKVLGGALANIVTSFDPEAIILFGGIANAGDLLFEPTRRYFNENLLSIYKNKIPVTGSKLQGGKAAILGVSSLISDK